MRVLIPAEDILHGHCSPNDSIGLTRVDVGEELECVSKALAGDSQTVVRLRRVRALDTAEPFLYLVVSMEHECRRDVACRRCPDARARAKRGPEEPHKAVVPRRVEGLEQCCPRVGALRLEQFTEGN